MGVTVELDDDLAERIDRIRNDDESYEEFIREVVRHYEQEGRFLREGHSGYG